MVVLRAGSWGRAGYSATEGRGVARLAEEPMLVEAALVIGGLVTTLAIGAPIASSMVRPHMFRRPARRDAFDSRDRAPHTTVFEPLDLGEDPMEWPSQRGWASSEGRGLRWPSQGWDDEHFGSHWRDGTMVEVSDLGFHAMAQRRYDASVGDEEVVKRNEAAALRRQRAPAQGRTLAQDRGPRAANAHAGQRTPSGVRRPRTESAPAPRSPKPQEKPETLPVRQAPSPAELEAAIAKVGLAGTVQLIMERTGWDFRKAAHYLARMRSR